MGARASRNLAALYWLTVAGVLVAGAVFWSRFGQFLVLVAILMVLIAPLRARPSSFLPLFAGLVVFVAAYLVTAPIQCRTGAEAEVGGPQRPARFCDSVVGVEYQAIGEEDPSSFPAFGASFGAGLIVAAGAWLLLRRRGRAPEVVVSDEEAELA
jgi:hypothetical protein